MNGSRLEYLLSIPWVREIPHWKDKGIQCSGYRNRYSRRPIPCKNKAHFRYIGSRHRDHHARTGSYCYSHTISNLFDADWYRFDKWRAAKK